MRIIVTTGVIKSVFVQHIAVNRLSISMKWCLDRVPSVNILVESRPLIAGLPG